jgi:hypothetical protein
MPRKEHKPNLGQRIAALQHAEASHSGEKAVFGGQRLILPGVRGRNDVDTPGMLPTTWTTPLLEEVRQEDSGPSSPWARWSAIDISDDNNENENAEQKLNVSSQRRKNELRSHEDAYLGHEISNVESSSSSQINKFMNGLLVEQKSSETVDSLRSENKSLHHLHAADLGRPEERSEPSPRVNQNAYYNQRSSRGRLGIDERIDVFEPNASLKKDFSKEAQALHSCRKIR